MDSSERLKSKSQIGTQDVPKVIVTKDTNISLNVNSNIQAHCKSQSPLMNAVLVKKKKKKDSQKGQ